MEKWNKNDLSVLIFCSIPWCDKLPVNAKLLSHVYLCGIRQNIKKNQRQKISEIFRNLSTGGITSIIQKIK